MKMTKELKEVVLKGFEEILTSIVASRGLARSYEKDGNEQQRNYWLERSQTLQNTMLKGIEDLIEVEEEGE